MILPRRRRETISARVKSRVDVVDKIRDVLERDLSLKLVDLESVGGGGGRKRDEDGGRDVAQGSALYVLPTGIGAELSALLIGARRISPG